MKTLTMTATLGGAGPSQMFGGAGEFRSWLGRGIGRRSRLDSGELLALKREAGMVELRSLECTRAERIEQSVETSRRRRRGSWVMSAG